jgi:hypothetical protein
VFVLLEVQEQTGRVLERKALGTFASIKNAGGRRMERIEILSTAISYVQIHALSKALRREK